MEPKPFATQAPCLPENAPFTAEQRAYLNGFLAGLFSRMPAPAEAPFANESTERFLPLVVLFGSQTGNAETLARRVAKEAGKRGFAPTVQDLGKYPMAQLGSEERVLIVTSTFGDGEPPDNATAFWQALNRAAAPALASTRFSICALGDSSYPKFCGFGKALDARFEALGAQRAHPRVDCDLDFEEPFRKWLDAALANLAGATPSPAGSPAPSAQAPVAEPDSRKYSRAHPFVAMLLTNRKLNGPGSAKDTRHFEIGLGGSELTYEAGDALGVCPLNCPDLVKEIMDRLGCRGEEPVPGCDGGELPLREALLRDYDITRIGPNLLKAIAERSKDDTLSRLTTPGVNGELTEFLRGREVVDLLLAYREVSLQPAEFVALLKRLQPRLYSISSSPKTNPGQVHLTVNVVRFEALTRRRKGVCSTFLSERVGAGQPLAIFVHQNKNFRPPANPDAPMIMVGPGTGIAPFRAFLQERRAVGAQGENWLFFGDQHAAEDFLYREELESMQRDGVLSRLETAFSRDQPEKVYVQHRMRENARPLFELLERGGHFYVCGDASRMARDVDGALHEVVQAASNLSFEKAAEYVARLKAEKRYLRDVY